MRAIKLTANVGDDHTLRLNLPQDVAAGPAEVIVLLPEEKQPHGVTLDRFLDNLQDPEVPMSKEEVERYLTAERASWD